MTRGDRVIVWHDDALPTLATIEELETLDGAEWAVVRCDQCDDLHIYERDRVQPLERRVVDAALRGSTLGPGWGRS